MNPSSYPSFKTMIYIPIQKEKDIWACCMLQPHAPRYLGGFSLICESNNRLSEFRIYRGKQGGREFGQISLTVVRIKSGTFQFISVTQSSLTLCEPMDYSMPGLLLHHLLLELAQTHVHRISDAMQPSLPLLSPSPLPSIFPSIGVFSNESILLISSVSSVQQLSSVLTLCDLTDCSIPGLPVLHQLLELTQTHVHRVGDAIQPSHLLSPLSPPASNPSQQQGLFQ